MRRTVTNSASGFSLIELLVVIGLIAIIASVALPSVGGYFRLTLNTAARNIASNMKEAYNGAIMTGRVHRMVYDLKEQAFWVESGPSTLLLDTQVSKEKEERRRRFSREGDKPPPSAFQLERSITRKKVPLPRGVTFEDILTEASAEALTEGRAYTHIFPHGLAEQTIVHLKDESKHQVTLILSPLIGKTKVIDRYVREGETLE